MNRRFCVTLLLAATLALSSFRVAEAEATLKIRIAWTVPVANWASILLAKKELARHLGQSYSLETVHFGGTPEMITALATGDVDIADLAYSSLGLAIENAGMNDLRIIGDELQDGVDGYYSQEFMVLNDSGIAKVEDLKGRVLAVNAAGSAVDIALRAMLREHGLDDRKDVTIVEAGFPNMKAMLLGKKADLVTEVLPFAADPGLREKAHDLFLQKEAIGSAQMLVWTARARFLAEHRAAMVDFMEDTLRIVHFYLDPAHHAEAVRIAAALTKQPPQRFDAWLFTKADYYRDPNLIPNLDALQANLDTQQRLGLLKAGIDVKRYAELGIVREAARRLK
ncbi:MAG TPA: ABC transporter substrate-binding protein [Stellaceae bacterium]|nr:ABC transporter substrate-binding protein [Stellaceae bacterium]